MQGLASYTKLLLLPGPGFDQNRQAEIQVRIFIVFRHYNMPHRAFVKSWFENSLAVSKHYTPGQFELDFWGNARYYPHPTVIKEYRSFLWWRKQRAVKWVNEELAVFGKSTGIRVRFNLRYA